MKVCNGGERMDNWTVKSVDQRYLDCPDVVEGVNTTGLRRERLTMARRKERQKRVCRVRRGGDAGVIYRKAKGNFFFYSNLFLFLAECC